MTSPLRIYEVQEILDRMTLAISGKDIGGLPEGVELSVIGVGPVSQRLGGAIVAEKARVVVVQNNGFYALVKPKARAVTKRQPYGMFFGETIETTTREPISVDEKAAIGNPGSQPIRVGDPVISPDDFARYVIEVAPKAKTT